MFAADTILPQNSGFSFIITTSIWIDIYKCVCVCVCTPKQTWSQLLDRYIQVCVCVCVCARTKTNSVIQVYTSVCVCVCVCVCARARARTPKQTRSFKGAVGHTYQLFTRDSKASHSPENLRFTADRRVHMATELFRGGVTSPATALFPRADTQQASNTWVLTHRGGNGKRLQYSCHKNPGTAWKSPKIWLRRCAP